MGTSCLIRVSNRTLVGAVFLSLILSPKAGYPIDVTMMGTLEKSLKYDMSVSNKQVFT